jgi:hypothetical protein
VRAKRAKSVSKTIATGQTKHFSNFQDYANYLRDRGDITAAEDLVGPRQDLLSDILFRWVQGGQLACVFAMKIANDPKQAGWLSLVAAFGEDLPWRIQPALEAAAQEAEAIQIIIPRLTTPEDCVRLIHALCRHTAWSWQEIPTEDPAAPDLFLVGLRWSPPSAAYTSWVLGFAPFAPMPFTRRFEGAPFIALALRPSRPMLDRAPPADTAHLAHMDDTLGADAERRADFRERTVAARAALLIDDYAPSAKARVTFTLPPQLRPSLTSTG